MSTLLGTSAAQATTRTVNSTADAGGSCPATCTLRAAVSASGAGDTINFDGALFGTPQTITLTAGEILISHAGGTLTITGPGANLLTISGNNASRIFRVANTAPLTTFALSGVTITDGKAADVGGGVVSDGNLTFTDCVVDGNNALSGGTGGGVYEAGGTGTFTNCAFTNNQAIVGGGVHVINASASFTNCTVSGNVATTSGGGINIETIGTGTAKSLTVHNSTIAYNRSPGTGGMVVKSGGGVAATAHIGSSIIANNTGGNLSTTAAPVTIDDQGFNLASDSGNGLLAASTDLLNTDPRLGPLSLNGATTPTHALLGGSPALDQGKDFGVTNDQRNVSRPFFVFGITPAVGGDGSDIGAIEMHALIVTTAGNDGTGSLRSAMDAANVDPGLDDILFASPLFDTPQTIDLLDALADINTNLTITGPGANLLTVRRDDAAAAFPIFRTGSDLRIAISGMTISNGLNLDGVNGQDGSGGGIAAFTDLALTGVNVTGNDASYGGGVSLFGSGTFMDSTFSGNIAELQGGGIDFSGQELRVVGSTVSGNTANGAGFGGGIENLGTGGISTLTVVNSTIVNNTGLVAGGIFNAAFGGAATTTLRNSIIANNSPMNLKAEVFSGADPATVTSLGFNLASDDGGGFLTAATDQINTNPKLGPLSLNAGTTPTHALLGGSPALDKGNSSGRTTDQRGAERPFTVAGITPPSGGDHADIGAVEMQALIVTTAADGGAGSLRVAMGAANSGTGLDDILFASPFFDTPRIIDLTSQLPTISSNLTINGPGANLLTVRRDDAAPGFPVFKTDFDLRVAISGLTISNGLNLTGVDGQDGFGGGIEALADVALTAVNVTGNHAKVGGGVELAGANGTFTDSTFSGNTADSQGGGINFQGNGGHQLSLTGSTVSGNTANDAGFDGAGLGGGIENDCSSTTCALEVVNSTIVNNVEVGFSGGLETFANGGDPTTTVRNSIIAHNTNADLFAFSNFGTPTVSSLGFNLTSDDGAGFLTAATDQINTDPKLGPLSLNGGTTPTHALLGGSPALDTGNSSGRTTDQRGAPRPFTVAGITAPSGGDHADIGAVEMQAILVMSAESSGAGTLNEALATANGNGAGLDDILFASPLFDSVQTIDLLAALPLITSNVTINGPAANLLTVRRDDAAPDFGIFRNTIPGFNIAISGMTISNGLNVKAVNGGDGNGGGVESRSNLAMSQVDVTGNHANLGGGVLLLLGDGVFSNSTVSGNTADSAGGGIYFEGDGGHVLRLTSSTVSGNTANGTGNGGGIENQCASGTCTLEVVNSTIVNNVGTGGGGIQGVAEPGSAMTTLRNSIVADNSAPDLSTINGGSTASMVSLGFNLTSDNGGGFLTGPGDQINTNPKLAPLGYYGGTVRTHALLEASPALDAGDSSGATADERGFGFLRPVNLGALGSPPGDTADIGAWEAQARDLLFIGGFERD